MRDCTIKPAKTGHNTEICIAYCTYRHEIGLKVYYHLVPCDMFHINYNTVQNCINVE